jgi:RNA polymerase sigma-70 factor, ECF subfamily
MFAGRCYQWEEAFTLQIAAGDLATVIQRARSLDQDASSALYQFVVTPVYRYLSARLSTVEEAEELTQEVMVAAFAGIQGLRAEDEAGLFAWLFQIARHKFADHLRRRYRRPTSPLEDAGQMADRGPRPEELAERAEEKAALRQAVEDLTPEQREVILCKYVLGYSNEKTAESLGKNSNAVNQLHHRALGNLHRLLTRVEAPLR